MHFNGSYAALYAKFIGTSSSADTHINTSEVDKSSDEESPFITENTLSWNDGCDVPLDVVESVVTTGTIDDSWFTLNDSGAVV